MVQKKSCVQYAQTHINYHDLQLPSVCQTPNSKLSPPNLRLIFLVNCDRCKNNVYTLYYNVTTCEQ